MAQDPGSRLISTIRKQNEKTIYFCTAENISPNVAVHEIRKSFKRIRALLHFYDDLQVRSVSEFNQKVKEAGRELSALRESFVNVQLFERELAGNQLIADRRLKDALDKLMQKNYQLLEDHFTGNGLCETIQKIIYDFNRFLESSNVIIPYKKQLFQQVLLTFHKSFGAFQSIPDEQPPAEMHELRKKVKRLWYQLDFLRFIQPRFFRLKTDQLNHISEQLGEDHDLSVFLEELKKDFLAFDSEEIEILQNQVLHLREVNLLKLNPRLLQFFNEPPEAFEKKMRKIFKVE